MKNIPYLLIYIRLCLGPVIIYLAYHGYDRLIAVLMTIGLLSDIFDGIIARQLSISTEKLRRCDSQTDLVFWLSVFYSSWVLHSTVLKNHIVPLVVLVCMELLCYLISIYRFRREASAHAYLSKLFGLMMFFAFFNLFYFGQGGIVLLSAIIIGLISYIDGILIVLTLPRWTHDVPSCYHAYLIKKGKEIKKYKLFN
jgi:CDP-diacylglycerol--glycerol-3-phosphate 3-phosphatidyltransferase